MSNSKLINKWIFDFSFVIIGSGSVRPKEKKKKKKNRTFEYSKLYQKMIEEGAYKIDIYVVYICVY